MKEEELRLRSKMIHNENDCVELTATKMIQSSSSTIIKEKNERAEKILNYFRKKFNETYHIF